MQAVCNPVLSKVPSSTKLALGAISMKNFDGKLSIFNNSWLNFCYTHPCLRKISGKNDPCLENLGP